MGSCTLRSYMCVFCVRHKWASKIITLLTSLSLIRIILDTMTTLSRLENKVTVWECCILTFVMKCLSFPQYVIFSIYYLPEVTAWGWIKGLLYKTKWRLQTPISSTILCFSGHVQFYVIPQIFWYFPLCLVNVSF